MSNDSCLSDCLKCQPDEGNHSFKLKNTKKWITLTKHAQNNVQVQKEAPQRLKYQPFIKLYQVPCTIVETNSNVVLQAKSVDLNERRSSRKSTSPNNNNDSVEFIKSKPLPIRTFVVPKNCQNRPRSCSLGHTKKPIITSRPIHFIYSQGNDQRSLSAQKKSTNRMQNRQNNGQLLQQQYLISPIKQQPEQRQKRSSLFQGAKSIVSRLVTSRKHNEAVNASFDPKTVEKPVKVDVQTFYDNVRLCQTENFISLTNQSILTDGEQKIHRTTKELSLDQIPMSPQSKHIDTYSKFKMGRLLGVGKWAHVYLCQEKQTNSIFAVKEIFKESIQTNYSYGKIGKSIDRLINLNCGKLMNVYAKFETKQKLCLLVEYCQRSLYDQLKEKGLFPLEKLKKYTKDLIQAVVFLHENEISHGNLNIFQIFMNFNECKLKPSIPYDKREKQTQQNELKSDIEGLAIVIFQMAHGLVPTLLPVGTLYQKQKLYQNSEMRKKIISFIHSRISLPQSDPVYILVNDLIKTLLEWNENYRLMASQCINHKFFALSQKC